MPRVLIIDYQTNDDFVIELKTKSPGDRLVLAKVEPKEQLDKTISMVQERLAAARPEPALTNDILIIPRLNFDITRQYSEIEGLRLVPTNPKLRVDLILRSAVQNTKFEMNEKGVELRSENHMAFGCARAGPPVTRHIMIFDKPFLILMQRKEAKVPYFALWVENPEILVSWK